VIGHSWSIGIFGNPPICRTGMALAFGSPTTDVGAGRRRGRLFSPPPVPLAGSCRLGLQGVHGASRRPPLSTSIGVSGTVGGNKAPEGEVASGPTPDCIAPNPGDVVYDECRKKNTPVEAQAGRGAPCTGGSPGRDDQTPPSTRRGGYASHYGRRSPHRGDKSCCRSTGIEPATRCRLVSSSGDGIVSGLRADASRVHLSFLALHRPPGPRSSSGAEPKAGDVGPAK